MDGATKIVKGDTIMSLIITVINFVGGIVTGMVMGGSDLATVLGTYTIATIGDGLVSQLPALMISTATGMIVTRSVSEENLNTDVLQQFKSQPKAILSTGVILLLLGLFPGTPTLPLLLVGAGLGTVGFLINRQMSRQAQQEALAQQEAQAEPAPPAGETDYFKDISHVYDLLAVEPIEMEFGYSLIPLVDEASGGKMINRIVIFRRQYAQEMGFVIPSIRLRDGASLGTNQYIIKIRGEEVARGEILVDYYLALEPSSPAGEIDGIETVEPAYGIPSRWILPENKEMAEIYGYTVITPLTVMLTHLSETVKKHAYELLNRSETIQLVENLKKTEPDLVAEAIPGVLSYATLEKILRSLLREGVPIKDLGTIVETAVEAWGTSHDLDLVTEQVRGALSRTITRKFCQDGQLRVVTLDAEVEKKILGALTKNEHGTYLALGPDVMQQIVTQLGELRKKFNELSQTPVVLTSQIIRAGCWPSSTPMCMCWPSVRSPTRCRSKPSETSPCRNGRAGREVKRCNRPRHPRPSAGKSSWKNCSAWSRNSCWTVTAAPETRMPNGPWSCSMWTWCGPSPARPGGSTPALPRPRTSSTTASWSCWTRWTNSTPKRGPSSAPM